MQQIELDTLKYDHYDTIIKCRFIYDEPNEIPTWLSYIESYYASEWFIPYVKSGKPLFCNGNAYFEWLKKNFTTWEEFSEYLNTK